MCLGVPAIFLLWAGVCRFLYDGQVEQAVAMLWWPFALLGIFSSILGFQLLRTAGAHDSLNGLQEAMREYGAERQSLQTKIDFLTAEREIGMILNDNLERRVVLDRVLEMTANLLRTDPEGELCVYLREGKSGLPVPAAARSGSRALNDRDLKKVVSDDRILRQIATQARVVFASEGDRTRAWIPLLDEGAVAGVLEIRMAQGQGLPALKEHLEEYGRFLSLAIRAPELYRRAAYDPLTGLGSRRRFDQLLGAYVERSRQGRGTFSMIMIDVDHFKKVNDTHGHAAGDAVLRGVADTIRKNLRRNSAGTCDAFRYGGEEMSVLVGGASNDDAALVAERIRRALERKAFLYDGKRIRVTASLGVAMPGNDPETVLVRADACLYKAKQSGRNRVVIDA